MQADEPVELPKGSFDKVMAMKDRENMAPSAPENAADAKCAEVRGFGTMLIVISWWSVFLAPKSYRDTRPAEQSTFPTIHGLGAAEDNQAEGLAEGSYIQLSSRDYEAASKPNI